MRAKFARTFLSVREFISSHNAPVEKIKEFLEYSSPYLKLQVTDCKTVRDVLFLIGEKSTLIDISVLEELVNILRSMKLKNSLKHTNVMLSSFVKRCLFV